MQPHEARAIRQKAPVTSRPIRLNVGCGTDYRSGFLNIDGSTTLPRVDLRLEIAPGRIPEHFEAGSVDHILASDVLEHFHHWEAVALLEDFHSLLRPGGSCELRVPDAKRIIRSLRMGTDRKLALLFGGQDRPQGVDPAMDESRRRHPEWFCHRYGWTRRSLAAELQGVGFKRVRTQRAGTNFVATAVK